MKRKKSLTSLLAVGMSLSLLAGCGGTAADSSSQPNSEEKGSSPEQEQSSQEESEAEAAPSEAEADNSQIVFPLEEPIEVSVLCDTASGDYTFEDTPVFQWMEEKTNVHLTVTDIAHADMEEKSNLLINSDSYPDIFLRVSYSPSDIAKYGGEGIFIPLEDLLKEYAPNYCGRLDEVNGWDTVTSADGHIYSTYQINKLNCNRPALYINQTWLDRLNLEMPTSKDEFYEVLKAFKEQDADGDGDPSNEIPLAFCSDIAPTDSIVPYLGIYHEGWWSPWSRPEDMSELVFWPAEQEGRDYLEYMAKLYDEGLLYKDCFVTTWEQLCGMGGTGTAFGVYPGWASWQVPGAYDPDKTDEENTVLQYVALPPFEAENGKLGTSEQISRGAFMITDKCEYPEIMTAWVDLLYSDEGSKIACYGFEGVHYELIDGTHKPLEDPATGKDYEHISLGMGTTFIPAAVDLFDPYVDLEKNPVANLEKEFDKMLTESGMTVGTWPTLDFTEEETEELSVINQDLDTYRKNYRAEIITGAQDLDSTWDSYISKLKDMGLDRAVELYNAAYQRFLAQ